MGVGRKVIAGKCGGNTSQELSSTAFIVFRFFLFVFRAAAVGHLFSNYLKKIFGIPLGLGLENI